MKYLLPFLFALCLASCGDPPEDKASVALTCLITMKEESRKPDPQQITFISDIHLAEHFLRETREGRMKDEMAQSLALYREALAGWDSPDRPMLFARAAAHCEAAEALENNRSGADTFHGLIVPPRIVGLSVGNSPH